MKLQKRGPIMVQQTNKNGDKKRQFPETRVCTVLQKNKISKIKLSEECDLLPNTESNIK